MRDINKEDSDSYPGDWGLAFIVAIGVAVMSLYSIYNKDKLDNFYFKDENAVFIEAKHPFGSLVNKDTIILTHENIVIRRKFLFSTNDTTYPYSILKKFVFDSLFDGYKLTITYPAHFIGSNSIAFYFNNKNTFDSLYNQFQLRSKNRCIISKYN
jgi:hypothetical protein